MQIQLKQQHIEQAIKAYVSKAGIQFPIDKIDFTAGRGSAGLTATIEMQDPFLGDLPATNVEAKPQASETKAETAAAEPKAEKSEKAKPASKQAVLETPEPDAGEPEPAEPEQVDQEQPTDTQSEPAQKASLFG